MASADYHSDQRSGAVPPGETRDRQYTPDVGANGQPDFQAWAPQKQEIAVMLTLSSLCLMVAIDATIIVTSLPNIADDLDGTSTEAFWVGTSYLLTSAVFQTFIGGLSDVFGRQPLTMLSLLFFTLGTIVAAVADDFVTLLAGRSIQGIGGGGIIAMTYILFADIVPLRHRSKWYGIVQGPIALGTILGPLLGGAIAQNTTWRWVFYLNFPLCGIGIVMILIFVKLKSMTTATLKDKLLRVDWFGGCFFVASTTSFLIAISRGGTETPWDSWRTLVPLILGVVGMMASLYWEWSVAKQPFIPLTLFSSVSAVSLYGCTMAHGCLLFGHLYFMPIYFDALKEESPTMVGVCLFPLLFSTVPSSIIIGLIISRTGHFRWAVWTGCAISVLASGLLILWDIDTSIGAWIGISIVLGIGHGILLTVLPVAAQTTVKAELSAYAATTSSFVRHLGMPLGVAIGSSVFQNIIKHQVQSKGLPSEMARDAEGFIQVLGVLEEGMPWWPQKTAILDAYASAIQGVFITFVGIAGLGLLLSLLTRSHSMDQELKSGHVILKPRENASPVGGPGVELEERKT